MKYATNVPFIFWDGPIMMIFTTYKSYWAGFVIVFL